MVTVASQPPAQSVGLRQTPPVKIWAGIGALLLAFELYVVAKWVTGPNFEPVPAGPSSPPTWMKFALNAFQYGGIVVALVVLYYLLVRPWRRERRVTIDGIFCVVVILSSIYDPLSNYFQPWFTYNAYLVNFGSIMGDLPGVLSRHEPGATQAWSILMLPAAYVYVFMVLLAFGRWFMGGVARRWPRLSAPGLVSVVWLTMCGVDLILEGLLFMPLGFWSYGGGRGALFVADRYWALPLQEVIFFASVFTAVVSLRYFVDDRGRCFAERGIDDLKTSPNRTIAVRFLAVFGAVQVCLLLFYHGPNALVSLHAKRWPNDVQSRSYFTNYICGEGTDYACPGPDIPLWRGSSVHLDPHGKVVVPDGTKPPTFVPFGP